MSSEQNYFCETTWTWRDRLRFKLFPSRHCELPVAPARFADCVVVKTYISLSIVDRLRVLLTGTLVVETKTVTEHMVGGTVTSSVAYPDVPRKVRRQSAETETP
jgi:hypothetical protein